MAGYQEVAGTGRPAHRPGLCRQAGRCLVHPVLVVVRPHVVPGMVLASGRRNCAISRDLRISMGQAIEPVSARSTMTPASSLCATPAWLPPRSRLAFELARLPG